MTRSAAGAMEPGRAAQGRWRRHVLAFGAMALLLLGVGVLQSWSVMLAIVNLCLISAILALGVNIQWGYAGLFNAGVMGWPRRDDRRFGNQHRGQAAERGKFMMLVLNRLV